LPYGPNDLWGGKREKGRGNVMLCSRGPLKKGDEKPIIPKSICHPYKSNRESVRGGEREEKKTPETYHGGRARQKGKGKKQSGCFH